MPNNSTSTRRIYAVILAGLSVWAIFLAVGAYRFNHNPWRGIIVLACFALFAGGWLLLVRRLLRKKPNALDK